MYGETGGLLRAELSELLRQHRIQQRIGGGGSHTVPVTTTPEERQQIGEQIRRYRQSALVWSHQATVAVAPGAASTLSKAPANPFRTLWPGSRAARSAPTRPGPQRPHLDSLPADDRGTDGTARHAVGRALAPARASGCAGRA